MRIRASNRVGAGDVNGQRRGLEGENAGLLQMRQEILRPLTHDKCCLPPTVQSSDTPFDTVPSLTPSLSDVLVTPRKTLGYSIWFRERTFCFKYHVTSSVIHTDLPYFIFPESTANTKKDPSQTMVLGASCYLDEAV